MSACPQCSHGYGSRAHKTRTLQAWKPYYALLLCGVSPVLRARQAGSFPATPFLPYCACNVGQLCVSPRRWPRSAYASPLAARLPVPDLLSLASRLRVRPPPRYDGLSENNLYALNIELTLYSVKGKIWWLENIFAPVQSIGYIAFRWQLGRCSLHAYVEIYIFELGGRHAI